jgi:hypothetical protein
MSITKDLNMDGVHEWLDLAFQTFTGSKSLNLDLMEEGLLDIPSE